MLEINIRYYIFSAWSLVQGDRLLPLRSLIFWIYFMSIFIFFATHWDTNNNNNSYCQVNIIIIIMMFAGAEAPVIREIIPVYHNRELQAIDILVVLNNVSVAKLCLNIVILHPRKVPTWVRALILILLANLIKLILCIPVHFKALKLIILTQVISILRFGIMYKVLCSSKLLKCLQ